MTDRGTRVRWTTAALVAPTAAALFTGTTVWAAGHQPLPAAKPAAAVPAVAKTVDPAIVELRAQIDANSAKVDALRATVAALRAKATSISGGTATGARVVASSTRSGSTSYTSSKNTSSKSTSSKKYTAPATKTSAPKTVVHVSTPAPPPPSNTTTGASGAVK